jgi:hypothetical protein
MTRRNVRALVVVLVAAFAVDACGSSPTAPNTGAPPRVVNSAPGLELTTQGPPSCNPVGQRNPFGQPGCSVTLTALAQDADGDPLSYSWSGTSSFSPNTGYCQAASPSSNALCTIRSPEEIIVGSVTVRDDHGHEVSAHIQVIGEGVNHPPSVRLSPPFRLSGGSVTLEMFGSIEDPDEPGLCTEEHVVSGSAAGDCKPAVAFWSSCLEGGPTVDIYRTAQSGTCEVTLKVRDSAGLVGTTVTSIRY